MLKYKVADVVFEADFIYAYTPNLCKDYLYTGDEPALFKVKVSPEQLAKEKSIAPTYPEAYLESLAVFRKLCEHLLSRSQGIIFHSSAIMVDGNAYLFTAPSGTGKSTHARLWREMLKDRAIMVNDDKPIIRYVDGEFYVYGTPWNGKHGLGTNCRAKIKAICNIYQAKENKIEKANIKDILPVILNQTLRPTDLGEMDKLLSLISKLLESVDLYKLGCNISREAAELSYTTMSGDKL